MNPLRAVRALLRRDELDREIDAELRFHLEQCTAENLAAGMPAEVAAREARRRFGNLQTVREECRDARGASLGEMVLQDLRYGLRGLRNSPGFTAVAVLSLALGIGATTTVFSLIDAALLRPLAVPEAHSLFSVHEQAHQGSRIHVVSYPDYLDYRELGGVFSDLLAWTEASASLNVDGRAEQSYGALVSGNYFSTLGVRPALGRLLGTEDDRTPGAHPVVVVSSSLWQGRFGGDPSVLGRTIKLNGHPFTVVGVTPRTFTSTYGVFAPAFYVPLAMQVEVLADPERFGSRQSNYLKITGRLRAGVSREQAQAALTLLHRQLEEAHPDQSREETPHPPAALELAPVGAFPGDIRLGMMGIAALLLAIVGFVLLIACANVAGMLLARATVRQHEMAVRLALGATRRRLIRQLLTESAVLFCLAAALGVGLTAAATRWLTTLSLPAGVPFALDASIDWRVLAFALLLALLTGTLFGLAPALEAARADLQAVLKDAPAQGVRRARLRQAFVVGQLALTLVLLVGAGLAGRALRHAQTIYPGRQPETVWTASLNPSQLGYDAPKTREVYRRLIERLAALPGVEAVSMVRLLDVGGGYSRTSLEVEAVELEPECGTVAPGYLETLGITLLEGRDFDARDVEGAPGVVLVNETMARRFWPGTSALGRRVSFGEGKSAEIVGVVENGRHRIVGQVQPPFVYFPFLQSQAVDMTLVWRQRGDGARGLAAVRREVEALDPDLALHTPMTLLQAVRQVTLPWRVAGALAVSFGFVGLALAILGVYGLVSYTFRQRTQEIGVRVALGARRRDVHRLVLMQGLKLALLGVGVGAALALGLTRALEALLFGIRTSDQATYATVGLLLVVVTLVACWLPARRAARIDPMTALRRG